MRAYRLEADREEEIRRSQASGLAFGLFVELRVAEGLDRLDPAFSEIPRHALDQHPAQPATGERGDHPGGRQQDGVGRDRRGRKRHGPRHVRRRREHHEPSGHAVDVDELAAGAPLQERLGDPGLLLQLRVAAGARPLGRYRIELPVDAPAAWSRKVLERIERQIDKAPRHRPLLDERNSPAKHPPPSNQDDRTRKTCGTGGIRHFPPRPAGRPITPPTRGWAAPAGSHLARRAGSRGVCPAGALWVWPRRGRNAPCANRASADRCQPRSRTRPERALPGCLPLSGFAPLTALTAPVGFAPPAGSLAVAPSGRPALAGGALAADGLGVGGLVAGALAAVFVPAAGASASASAPPAPAASASAPLARGMSAHALPVFALDRSRSGARSPASTLGPVRPVSSARGSAARCAGTERAGAVAVVTEVLGAPPTGTARSERSPSMARSSVPPRSPAGASAPAARCPSELDGADARSRSGLAAAVGLRLAGAFQSILGGSANGRPPNSASQAATSARFSRHCDSGIVGRISSQSDRNVPRSCSRPYGRARNHRCRCAEPSPHRFTCTRATPSRDRTARSSRTVMTPSSAANRFGRSPRSRWERDSRMSTIGRPVGRSRLLTRHRSLTQI